MTVYRYGTETSDVIKKKVRVFAILVVSFIPLPVDAYLVFANFKMAILDGTFRE